MKMELIPFGLDDIDNILRDQPERADNLPYGAILLDRSGRVLIYNKAEGHHAGHIPAEVLGRDFFAEVSPCAVDTPLYKEFLKYRASGQANVVLDYAFARDGVPVTMRIHLRSTEEGKACWMFVKRV